MNAKTLIAIFFILLAIAAVWFFVLPAYDGVKAKNIQYQEKQAKIEEAEKTVAKLESLTQSYKNKQDQVSIILQMSPKGKNISFLISQMEALTTQSGVILYSLTFGDEQNASSGFGSAGKASKAFSADMKVSGTYEAFKNFLSDLEKSARLADVQSFGFEGKSGAAEASSLYDFNMKALFYYQ